MTPPRRRHPGARAPDPPPSDDRGRTELFELSLDLLATMDRAGHFTDLNPAAERILGWPRGELLGLRAIDLLHPDDRDRTLALRDDGAVTLPDVVEFENRYRCKDGSYRWLQWNARLVDNTWYAVARDVTDRLILEQRAIRDPLTGLPNRTGLRERLTIAVGRLERHAGTIAVLFVDLDHFKVINDRRGHEVGDRFLAAAAARLLETVRGIDAVARFGGDEFVILLEDVDQPSHVTDVAGRVVQALGEPIEIEGEEARIGASVGVTVASSAETTPELLLREADSAMYRAKARGGGCFALFDEDVRTEVERRVTAERGSNRADRVHYHGSDDRLQIVRECYDAYVSGDRSVLERHLADDLVFYSPADVGIDRARYFERCWPNAESIAAFELVRLIEAGDDVFVTYESTRTDGSRFRNTEVLTFDGDRICTVEVYFGWDLPDISAGP
jgi:diguanylate cyclase (GGDEF)-like protein/PAS domain S-box-containing protein